MARPLRLAYEGAVYHITSRGNEQRNIFLTAKDRLKFLKILEQVTLRYHWLCHAYCLMDNHYHLLIETPQANISLGMRQLNGIYTQYFNRTYKRVGHLFQGRFKGIIVEKDNHLLELARYIVLNPVRANVCQKAEDYQWSSLNATTFQVPKPAFLTREWLLKQFSASQDTAVAAYQRFVSDGIGDKPWERLTGQIYYGSEKFVKNMQEDKATSQEVPRKQRQPIRPHLNELLQQKDGILTAYKIWGYRLNEIAKHLDIHYTTVSRKLRDLEEELLDCKT